MPSGIFVIRAEDSPMESKWSIYYSNTISPANLKSDYTLYGRLMRDLLDAGAESAEEWLSQYHHCTDCLDFVMEYEGG
jgi:hypothetical protein